MAHINVFDSLFFTPIMLSDFYFFFIPAFIPSASPRMSCVCPVYVLCMSCVCPAPNPFYHLRSNLTFGLILPRIIEQVLCPRYSTFLSFLLLSFIDVREIYDLHCILSYGVSFTIHSVRCAPGVHPAPIPFYHLRSNLTFGPILPRIIEQVLCPRYSTFYPFLLLSFIDVREIYDLHCILSYTPSFTIHSVVYDTLRPVPNLSNICIIFYFFTPHLAFIPAPIPAFVFCLSSVYPAYILRAPGTHSVLHLRSNLTFSLILPRILEQVLCPRYSTFYPFLLLSFIDVREIYELHCILFILCVVYDTLRPACTRRAFLSASWCVSSVYPVIHPTFIRHPILSIIFGQILPSVLSYRGL